MRDPSMRQRTTARVAAPTPRPLALPRPRAEHHAARALERCDALAACTEAPGLLLRRCLTPAMGDAHTRLGAWMEDAGLEVRVDAIGNLRGRLPAPASPDAPTLYIGSHLDTIRDAGKYDGPLGVVLGLGMLEAVQELGLALPYAVEVVGFADEEGVRFARPFLGSRALTGTFPGADLALEDDEGVRLDEAMARFAAARGEELGAPRRALAEARFEPERALGYLELHIEQGPVLESQGLPVGVVTAIAGHCWQTLHFTGRAGHAGTTPMNLRRDALAGAAELALAVEALGRDVPDLVATVGAIEARPGGNNVIAGHAAVEVDVRSPDAGRLERALLDLRAAAESIARRRDLKLEPELHFDQAPVRMDSGLRGLLVEAVRDAEQPVHEMPSGAGHDARIVAPLVPSAMLFLRSPEGLSHHPDESVLPGDVAVALEVSVAFLQRLAARFEGRAEATS